MSAEHDVRIAHDDSTSSQRVAAGIWARATARRDSLLEPESMEGKLPGIQQSLGAEGASLHLAYQGETAVGFTLLVPHDHVLEVLYLGVEPAVWGGGVGSRLLAHVQDHARAKGHESLELWVIEDNERAIRTYERSGWSRTGDVTVRNASGRSERRFVRPTT